MDDEEKMLWMFTKLYGELTGACYAEVELDDQGDATAVNCMKNGMLCWRKSKVDIVFDYLTVQLDT